MSASTVAEARGEAPSAAAWKLRLRQRTGGTMNASPDGSPGSGPAASAPSRTRLGRFLAKAKSATSLHGAFRTQSSSVSQLHPPVPDLPLKVGDEATASAYKPPQTPTAPSFPQPDSPDCSDLPAPETAEADGNPQLTRKGSQAASTIGRRILARQSSTAAPSFRPDSPPPPLPHWNTSASSTTVFVASPLGQKRNLAASPSPSEEEVLPSVGSHGSLALPFAGTVVENVGAGPSWLSPAARRVQSAANLASSSGKTIVRTTYSSTDIRSLSDSNKRTGTGLDAAVPAWKKRTRKFSGPGGGQPDSVRADEFNYSAGLAPRTRARHRTTMVPSAAAATASPVGAARALPPLPPPPQLAPPPRPAGGGGAEEHGEEAAHGGR